MEKRGYFRLKLYLDHLLLVVADVHAEVPLEAGTLGTMAIKAVLEAGKPVFLNIYTIYVV